jgi:putative membrane protein
MHKVTGSCAGVLALLALAPAVAQGQGSRRTREFVQAAAQSDEFEILEGQTIVAQSSDPQVRAFALKMIHDHEATSHALRDAAMRAGVKPPPMALSTDQAQLLSALQSQHGRQFDQLYARHQVLAHHSALVVEQSYAASGDNPALRQAAASAVSLISAHLAMAEQMSSRLGGS